MTDNPYTKEIEGVVGQEPMREGEYPDAYFVGNDAGKGRGPVTKIARREDECGDNIIWWLDVYEGDELVASLNARYVARVDYVKGAAS